MNLLHLLRRLRQCPVSKNRETFPRAHPRGFPPLHLEDLEARTVPATTLTWGGGGHNNLWSDAANWSASGGTDRTPHDGDTVVFPDGALQLSNSNNIRDLTLAGVDFTGSGYDISGNGFSLTGGITVGAASTGGNGPTAPDTIEGRVTGSGTPTVDVAADFALVLAGGINSESLALNGAGTVQLGGTNSTGALNVQSGTLVVGQTATLSPSGSLTVGHLATLNDAGSITVGLSETLDDHGQITVANGAALNVYDGTLTVESDGTLTDAGTVTVGQGKSRGTLDDYGQIVVAAAGATGASAGQLQDNDSLTVESSGSLTDAGSVTVGSVKGAGGALDDPGRVTVTATGSLTAGGEAQVNISGTLDDGGSVTTSGVVNNTGLLAIEAGDTLNFSAGSGNLTGTTQAPAVLAATLTDSTTPVISLQNTSGLNLDNTSTGTSELILTAAPNFAPSVGQQFTLVASATGHPVFGLFDAPNGQVLQEGDTVNVGAYTFTISYKGGASRNDVVLTYVGLREFGVTINNNLSTPLLVDGTSVPTSGVVPLTAGVHTLTDQNNPQESVQFTVNADGTVSYDPTLQGVLTGAGTSTLGVQGVPVTIDPTAVAQLTSAFTVDGLSYLTAQAQTINILPGSFAVGYAVNGATTTLNFTVSTQDQVSFSPTDPSQGALVGLEGTNGNDILLLSSVQSVLVVINSDILLQYGTTTFTVNGRSYDAGIQSFPLPPGPFVIQYTSAAGSVTLNFSVSAQDQVVFEPTDPSQDDLASVGGSNAVTLLPFVP